MSSKKTSVEGQMGSGESDDEFYNVKLSSTQAVNETKNSKNKSVNNEISPPRTKVLYDYKFDSSSDEDSDDSQLNRNKTVPENTVDEICKDKVKQEYSSDENQLPLNTSKVVEKINEELKSIQSGSGNSKNKVEKSDGNTISSVKHIPATSVGVPAPVVVVPPPIMVPQPHPVMTMGPTGMIVPPAIGIANQNVIIPPANLLSIPGNIVRGPNSVGGIINTTGSPIMGVGNTNMINSLQNQGNVVGMTNDILQLQGNIMGIPAPGNMMQLPGLCMTGNMIPMQGNIAALQMGMQGGNIMANQTLINNQGNIIGNASNIMTNPGGVMMNPSGVMAVTNIMSNQGNIIGNVIGTPGNVMLNMNNLGSRLNYSANVLSSQAINNVGGRSGVTAVSEIGKHQMNSTEVQTKATEEWQGSSKQSEKGSPSKSPSPFDTDNKNWDVNDVENDEDSTSSQDSKNIREIPNTFKNDGSFMELFKKMSEANSSKTSNKEESSSKGESNEGESSSSKKPPVILSGIVGKRRGGRVLKTGLVKKVKKDSDNEEEKGPKDAWAMYMAEVKKYREASCEEEGKTRPLVK